MEKNTINNSNTIKISINNNNYVLSNLERYISYTIVRLSCKPNLNDFEKFNIKCNKDLEYFGITSSNSYNHFIKVFTELGILKPAENDYDYEKRYKIKRYSFNFDKFQDLIIKLFNSGEKVTYFYCNTIYNILSNKHIPRSFRTFMRIYHNRHVNEFLDYIYDNRQKVEELDVYSFYDDFLVKLNRKRKFTW